MVSISPVPKPVPVSYSQLAVLTPVLAAPVKSSLHVSVNPAGGAGTAAATGFTLPARPTMLPARPTARASASGRSRPALLASMWLVPPGWTRRDSAPLHLEVVSTARQLVRVRGEGSAGAVETTLSGRSSPPERVASRSRASADERGACQIEQANGSAASPSRGRASHPARPFPAPVRGCRAFL